MGLSKKTHSVHAEFATAQVDTVLVDVNSGDYVYVWSLVIEADSYYEVKFSGGTKVITGVGGITGAVALNKQGPVGEDLIITCDANTTVRILFDEV